VESKSKKKSYSKEFKIQAVERCKLVGIQKASEELGVCKASLSNWKNQLDPSKSDKKSSTELSYQELLKENIRLKKELSYVEEINDILKKSTAIFSNDKFRGLK